MMDSVFYALAFAIGGIFGVFLVSVLTARPARSKSAADTERIDYIERSMLRVMRGGEYWAIMLPASDKAPEGEVRGLDYSLRGAIDAARSRGAKS